MEPPKKVGMSYLTYYMVICLTYNVIFIYLLRIGFQLMK